MGSSSSTYIANRLNPTAETLAWHNYPHYEDTSWLRRPLVVPERLPPLPPVDFARRLYLAQHAYIGTIFSFLDEATFDTRLQLMYTYAAPPDLGDREACLAYAQVLLVFAFGQMYSVNQWTGHDGPPGFQYFRHALPFVPDVREDGSVLFVEVLSYAAYYMQTINRRDAAYLYMGMALRMAIALGLHQDVDGGDDSGDDAENGYVRERRRRLWWSTYSLERMLCVTSGHPISIRDDDIDVALPTALPGENPQLAAAQRHYTMLSRIQGRIGQEIYRKRRSHGASTSDTSSASLLPSIQAIMQSLVEWFAQLPADVRLDPAAPDAYTRRDVVSIHLHYYHCVNMTARPLLLYAVQRQMAATTTSTTTSTTTAAAARWQDGLSPDLVKIIDTAITAARSSTVILKEAAKFDLVATYGFIDGEQAFSAALLLVMVNLAFPYGEMNAAAMDTALQVLQRMAERGNRYVRACHTLLTKIRATKRLPEPSGQGDSEQQALAVVPSEIQLQPQPHQQQREQPQQLQLTYEGASDDPSVWADVMDSIGIDMDRQWIGMALMREGLGETLDPTTMGS
jgi:proline utilization trans-activator